jgi:hypothetical protein
VRHSNRASAREWCYSSRPTGRHGDARKHQGQGFAAIVTRAAWGLWSLLALAVAGCSGEGDAVSAPLEPGGGFKADPVDGVKAALSMPDQVPAAAALIQAEVSLQNTAGDVATVTVSRPCDVFDWVMRDAGGRIVMTKDPVACVDQPTAKALPPGSSLSERISIYLLPRVLQSGAKYVIEYRFWGQPAQVEFTARR